MLKVVIASKNPVKANAVLQGFSSYFPEIEIEKVSVPSGVSDQPLTDDETRRGAYIRAENAKEMFNEADFWVGIEGGIEKNDNGLTAFAWIVILSENKTGESRTTTFQLPAKVAQLIAEGYELGHANDIVFEQTNSKQKHGAVGLLTQNHVDRTGLYQQAVELALVPFINPKLF
ncbi:MAG TPA: inosine/xanthosine triphosphatase [Draconibacterium sp.]|nr:inosine/xanthosine triphosphatase [Draconibacterium sp.]